MAGRKPGVKPFSHPNNVHHFSTTHETALLHETCPYKRIIHWVIL